MACADQWNDACEPCVELTDLLQVSVSIHKTGLDMRYCLTASALQMYVACSWAIN